MLLIFISSSLLASAACDRSPQDNSGRQSDENVDERPLPESPDSPEVQPSTSADVELTRYERTTTPGPMARGNLDAQIQAAARSAERRGYPVGAVIGYVDLLKTRIQFFATYSDFDTAFETFAKLDEEAKQTPAAQRSLAGLEGAVHRFSESRARLEGIEGANAEDSLRTIALAVGDDLEPFVIAAREAANENPDYEHYVSLGSLLAAQGEFDSADEAYRNAINAYANVSPFPIAWVQFQRGVMWAERADRSENAVPLYEDAVRMIPGYVVANVHLAELQAEGGDVDGAIARLERIKEVTEDPEPAGLLSELYAQTDNPEKASENARRADEMYQGLLEKYPAAFADHATEFYLGPGDSAEKAWTLASENLERRQDARARLLAVEAAFAAGAEDAGCTVLRDAQGSPVISGSVPLKQEIETQRSRCNLNSEDPADTSAP